MKETEACKNMEIGNLRLMCSDLGKVRISSPVLRLEKYPYQNWTVLKVACLIGQYSLVSKMTRLELSGLESKRSWK